MGQHPIIREKKTHAQKPRQRLKKRVVYLINNIYEYCPQMWQCTSNKGVAVENISIEAHSF
jgi:hypothetical protein